MARANSLRYDRGFSLIEIMVALLILGVGVIGFVALALHSAQQAGSTALRAQAHILARDFIERIHANVLAWPDGFSSSRSSHASCTPSAPCADVFSMAAQEWRESRTLAASNLPQGDIAVYAHCHAEAPSPCVVVSWHGVAATPSSCLDSAQADRLSDACVITHFWPAGAP